MAGRSTPSGSAARITRLIRSERPAAAYPPGGAAAGDAAGGGDARGGDLRHVHRRHQLHARPGSPGRPQRPRGTAPAALGATRDGPAAGRGPARRPPVIEPDFALGVAVGLLSGTLTPLAAIGIHYRDRFDGDHPRPSSPLARSFRDSELPAPPLKPFYPPSLQRRAHPRRRRQSPACPD